MFDFGGPRARFWSLRAWILELPDLEFETSRLDCGPSRPPAFLWLGFPHSATQLDKCGTDLLPWGSFLLGLCPSSKALPNSGFSKKAKSPSLNYSTLDLHLSVHPSVHTTDAYIAPKALPKLGGGGVPPWGPSIRRPPKVCEACWTFSHIAFRYVLTNHRWRI